MTKEQKQLLLNDLVGRIPYGVKVMITELNREKVYELVGIHTYDADVPLATCRNYSLVNVPMMYVKPYLYPLSSMTNEQMEKIEEILIGHNPYMVFDFLTYGDIVFHHANVSVKAFAELMQFFDKEMLDYRGLIEKELAIDATGLEIYNKEE